MKQKLTAVGLCAACLLLGQNDARQKVQVGKTEHLDFAPGGTLRLENSTGEVTVEAWDQPGIEIATTRTSKDTYLAADRDKATQELNNLQISTKLSGNELIVTTEFPHHRAFPYVSPLSVVTNFDLEYLIKVPRNSNLIVRHNDGEVNVADVTGNIRVTARQGLISLRLTGEAPPSIDAKSDIGSVVSDFAGSESRHPWPFGHQFVQAAAPASAGAQNLHLKIGFGDIIILKAHNPPSPRPIT